MRGQMLNWSLKPVALLILLACTGSLCAQRDHFLSQKQMLAQVLDSLEMAKQIEKRNGRPIDELEKQSVLLRDSIDALKQAVPAIASVKDDMVHAPSSLSTGVGGRIKKAVDWIRSFSHTPFDMIIVIIGGIALLSGGVLVLGILRLIIGKRGRVIPTDSRRSKMNSETSSDHSVPLPPRRGDTAIRQIRDRIMHAAAEQPFSPAPQASGGDAEIKAALIAAARSGVSAAELARRFHMSVDQVSLILTVAQKNEKGR